MVTKIICNMDKKLKGWGVGGVGGVSKQDRLHLDVSCIRYIENTGNISYGKSMTALISLSQQHGSQ